MDGYRFDNLTRRLARGRLSRRRLLKGAAGGVAAGVAGGGAALLPAPDAAEAACKGLGRTCLFGGQCCSGYCVLLGLPPLRLLQCACPPGTENCGGVCVDPRTDVNNCGTCGHSCPAAACRTPTCSGGVCGSVPNPTANNSSRTAVANGICCDGTCVDSFAAPNCGTCGTSCGAANCCGGACCGKVCDTATYTCCLEDQVCQIGADQFCCGATQICGGGQFNDTCVAATRPCDECLPDEVCVDGSCCPLRRACGSPADNTAFCCDIDAQCVGGTFGSGVCGEFHPFGPRNI